MSAFEVLTKTRYINRLLLLLLLGIRILSKLGKKNLRTLLQRARIVTYHVTYHVRPHQLIINQ